MVRSGLLVCVASVLAFVFAQTAGAQSYEKAATLSVTPAEGLTSSGPQGGTFTPASRQYSVANSGDGLLAWTAVSNQPWVTIQVAPTGTGTRLVVGSQFATSGTVSIPLSLFRGTDAVATEGPAAITAFINYDTSVLQFQGVTQSSQLLNWYDKTLAAGENTPGRVSVVIYGINRNQITTFDNQIAGGTPSARINPFPLGSLRFSIVGEAGDTAILGVSELSMTNAEADTMQGVTFQSGLFSASTLPGGQSQYFSGAGVATVSINSNANSLPAGLQAATVTFSSNGGTATRPVALTVAQNCTTPPAPGQVQASDGDFAAHTRVTWAASTGATQYQVYRSEGTDPMAAQALSGWITGTSYNDTSAAAPSSGGGCSSSPTFTYYNYWVRAQNNCGTSPYSAPNSGYRGSGAKSAKSGALIETALPASDVSDDILFAEPSSALALHLVAPDRLVSQSLRARVESAVSTTATWEPRWSGDGQSVWIVFTPEAIWLPGEMVTVSVEATRASGQPVTLAQRFQIAVASTKSGVARIWQPIPGVDYNDEGLDAAGEVVPTSIDEEGSVPTFSESLGEPVRIGPATVFGVPQRVWLPVPEGTNPDDLAVYYYHNSGAGRGWYLGESVEGWMVPGSAQRLDLPGGSYVGILVQYGGIAQLGVPEGKPAATQASVASLTGGRGMAGDLLLFAAAMAFLIWRGRRGNDRSQARIRT